MANKMKESGITVEENSISSSSDEDNCDDASSYQSGLEEDDEEDEDDTQSACSISIASSSSESYSQPSDDHEEDGDDDNDNDEESAADGEDDEDEEEHDDSSSSSSSSSEDWNYKFFPNDNCRIRFNAEIEVYDTLSRNDYTLQEKLACFLSPKDKKAQSHRQNKSIAKLEWWMEETPESRNGSNRSKSLYYYVREDNGKGEPKFIARGLHQMTDSGYDRMNDMKNLCVEAVLHEQDAQWRDWHRRCIEQEQEAEEENERPLLLWDWDRISETSIDASRGAIIEAIKIAKRDRQLAEKAYLQLGKSEKQQQQQSTTTNKTNNKENIKENIEERTKATKTVRSQVLQDAGTKKPNTSPRSATPTTITTTLTSSVAPSDILVTTLNDEHDDSGHHDDTDTNTNNNDEHEDEDEDDRLEVVSVDSTLTGDRSLLTLVDDRSIVTPPTDDEETMDAISALKRRLSWQEQQHPCKAAHEAANATAAAFHHDAATTTTILLDGGKRRASAPPLRRH
ncbi:unnamed protein product [Cylindrotheca closterium]|uniref:Uncharacterized protein n=1 Tax=Cylindrotheca closterium TaxID=2856 RepID=A0AAD2CKK5_9STRA|nr:unnamed protein product [Cylindrotheca closterium]